MKNTFGNNLSVTVFGESHGPAIGAVLDGLSAGVKIDEELIKEYLSRRRPSGKTDTPRVEKDEYKIISGVFNGYSTGAPITVIVPNENVKSGDYEKTALLARPSHADYTAFVKYDGFNDYRGGGHFSGRITAALVAVGAIVIGALESVGVKIKSHVYKCGGATDARFSDLEKDFLALENAKDFPVIDLNAREKMTDAIYNARESGDSVGGAIETAIIGLPAGVGDPWFDSVESMLSHALFSLGGIKGVEFGAGFKFADMRGSVANDPFASENGKIFTVTNNNGGVNGGITNGMPVIFTCAVKPTPSIAKTQKTVNLDTGENAEISVKGRHDPAIVRRICPVIECVTAIVTGDLLISRYGERFFYAGRDKL